MKRAKIHINKRYTTATTTTKEMGIPLMRAPKFSSVIILQFTPIVAHNIQLPIIKPNQRRKTNRAKDRSTQSRGVQYSHSISNENMNNYFQNIEEEKKN